MYSKRTETMTEQLGRLKKVSKGTKRISIRGAGLVGPTRQRANTPKNSIHMKGRRRQTRLSPGPGTISVRHTRRVATMTEQSMHSRWRSNRIRPIVGCGKNSLKYTVMREGINSERSKHMNL